MFEVRLGLRVCALGFRALRSVYTPDSGYTTAYKNYVVRSKAQPGPRCTRLQDTRTIPELLFVPDLTLHIHDAKKANPETRQGSEMGAGCGTV